MIQSINQVNIIMYEKLLCGTKMKAVGHGVTALLIPQSGMRKLSLHSKPTRETKWSEYEAEVTSFNPLIPEEGGGGGGGGS